MNAFIHFRGYLKDLPENVSTILDLGKVMRDHNNLSDVHTYILYCINNA